MKRSPELAPLSREHHVALGVALSLRRADESDLADVVAGFQAFFTSEGDSHFDTEEDVLLGELPADMAARLVDEHADLRRRAASLIDRPTVERAHDVGERLTAHVRFEEREAFPHLEAALPRRRLAEIGRLLHAVHAI